MDGWIEYLPYLERATRIVAIVAAAFILTRVVKAAVARLTPIVAGSESDDARRAQRLQRAQTLAAILTNLSRVVLLAFVLVTLLSELGLNIAPILAGAGVVGLAVGFGAQSLVKDFFSGFFIVFENQMAIGDTVTIAGHTGTVERMTMRVTVLRDLDGNLHFVPNGEIKTVTVLGKEWGRATVDVTVPYREDLSRAFEVASAIASEYASEAAGVVVGEPDLGVQELGARGVTIRIGTKTGPGKAVQVSRELRRRLKSAFDAAGIEFAHSQDDAPPTPK